MEPDDREKVCREGAVSVAEACRLLGIKRTKLYAMMNALDIRYCKLGSRRVIPRAEITRTLAGALVGE